MLARGLVDKFRYNKTGNEVTLVKYFDPRNSPKADRSRPIDRSPPTRTYVSAVGRL